MVDPRSAIQPSDPSQHGETSELRRHIEPDWPPILVEVGAHDGEYLSNTAALVERGWHAVLIEPHPVLFRRLSDRYRDAPNVRCVERACSDVSGPGTLFVGSDDNWAYSSIRREPVLDTRLGPDAVPITCERLTDILERLEVPRDIGLLCVDAEGHDYEVLLGLDLARFRPRLILTEQYPEHEWKDAWKAALLAAAGYEEHRRIGCNVLWMAAERLPA